MLLSLLLAAVLLTGRTLVVSPDGPYASIPDALEAANAGDTIVVRGGHHAGPLVIDESVTLRAEGRAVIDGGGSGTVVTVSATDVRLQGFVVRGSGDRLDHEDAGISVEAPDALIEENRLEDVLFGVYLKDAPGTVVRGNAIEGKPLAVPRRGDLIRTWYSPGATVEDNVIRQGRDVIMWFSDGSTVRGNHIEGGRYGLHFMYNDDTVVEGNMLEGNSVGAFLMYSADVEVRDNLLRHNRGPTGYGIGLKDMDDVVAEDNVFIENRIGLHLDNSPRQIDSWNAFSRNLFALNDIGVSFLPSIQRNAFDSNSFVENTEQIEIQGGGKLTENRWNADGAGNYWSDYAGYDADGDGIGDSPYEARSLFGSIADRRPELRMFSDSPAALAIDFAARALPAIQPDPKIEDAAPLMRPTTPPWWGATETRTPLLAASGLLASLGALGIVLGVRRGGGPRVRRVPAGPRRDGGSATVLAVEGLTKRFGRLTAVDDLSFSLQPGEALALWGPNGAGKTTALRCVVGLLDYEGSIRVAGFDAARDGKKARSAIGFLPQELALYDMPVTDVMAFFCRLRRVPRERAWEALGQVGLREHATKRTSELSGGMKQRLGLAIALLSDPPVLLLDEPVGNLDVAARAEMIALIERLKSEHGKAVLFSSHRVEEVERLADRVLMMEGGRLIASGSPRTLSQRLGPDLSLRLVVADADAASAADLLRRQGFTVSANGRGLTVLVESAQKAAPISALGRAGFAVEDFEVDRGEARA